MMMNPICIYHHNCADGFTAAWAVREALGDIEFYGATYGDDPPDVTDRDVIMVDFAYKRPTIIQMISQSHSLLILDHHKSAAEDLESLPEPPGDSWADWYEDAIKGNGPARLTMLGNTAALFDMERSGAGIAWDFSMTNLGHL